MFKALVMSSCLFATALACHSPNTSSPKSDDATADLVFRVASQVGVASGSVLPDDTGVVAECKDGTSETYLKADYAALETKLHEMKVCTVLVPGENFLDICNQPELQDDSYRTIITEIFGRTAEGRDCLSLWTGLRVSKKTIALRGVGLTSIKALGGLNGVTELRLSGNSLEDLTGIETLTGLQKVDLSFNALKDVSKLTKLVNLQEINLMGNAEIADVSPLFVLPNLQKISLRGTHLPPDFDFFAARDSQAVNP